MGGIRFRVMSLFSQLLICCVAFQQVTSLPLCSFSTAKGPNPSRRTRGGEVTIGKTILMHLEWEVPGVLSSASLLAGEVLGFTRKALKGCNSTGLTSCSYMLHEVIQDSPASPNGDRQVTAGTHHALVGHAEEP